MNNSILSKRKTKSILIMIALILLSIASFTQVPTDFGEKRSMIFLTISVVLIGAAMFVWQYSDDKIYNSWNDLVKVIYDTNGITVESIFDNFKTLDTVLGKPWIGQISGVKGNCIVFGPNADGEYIYITDSGKNRIQLMFNLLTAWIILPEGEEWRLNPDRFSGDSIEGVIRYRFATAYMLTELTNKVENFVDKGVIDLSPIGTDMVGEIYQFNESFKLLGEDFYLCDTAGNEQLKIVSNLPMKTFRIKQVSDGTEIFKVTKRIFHILPHYDMYEYGNKIGRLRKKLDLVHDHFVADTTYGKLELRGMNAMLGKNFQVFINGEPIGTIAEKLNFSFNNIIFDNFVLVVNDQKYVDLMTAMAIMIAREKKRDRETVGAEME